MNSNCQYCYKSLDLANNDGVSHKVCDDDRLRRFLNNKCVICGINPFIDRCTYCNSCGQYGKYKNYIGPLSKL